MDIHLNKTVFVFDLHDVIIKKKYFHMLSHIIKKAYRLDLLIIFLDPRILFQIIKLLKTSRVPEQFIVELSKTWPRLSPLIEIIITMMNEQQPIQETIEIIKDLKGNGYKIYMLSNIGEQTFKRLKEKFPNIFKYFDGLAFVEQQDNWIQKPYPQAFEKFLNQFDLQADKCIFIDNNKKNVTNATNQGLHSILYTSPKKLYDELIALNVLS